ncbi:putative transcription factor GRF family [Arabidopsis thaliana]
MSSSLVSVSSGVDGARGSPVKCACGVDVTIFTSKSQENPGRPFFRCKTKRDPNTWINKRDVNRVGGHLFKWVEDVVQEEVEDALEKFGIITNELNKVKSEAKELHAMLQELKEEAELGKWKVCLEMCFVWFCLITINIVYVMLGNKK